MENRIILDGEENFNSGSNGNIEKLDSSVTKPNIFIGRPEIEIDNSKFPEWDIVPPGLFINPRIKKVRDA
jgi:hypothetical protein